MRNPIQVSRRNRLADMADFDDMFDRMLRSPFSLFDEVTPTAPANTPWFKPGFDVEETDEAILLTVDLPGMKKEDVNISLTDNVLTLSGERKLERGSKGSGRYERSYGRFQQSFSLPGTVDVGRVEAHLEDGVLHVALPKSEKAKPRNIQVQNGKGGFFSKLIGKKDESSEGERH